MNITLKEFLGGFRCSLIGHVVEEIFLEDEEWCKNNPDKDLLVKCKYCGDEARLYWSIKKNKLRAYQPNTGAIFGDIGRE